MGDLGGEWSEEETEPGRALTILKSKFWESRALEPLKQPPFTESSDLTYSRKWAYIPHILTQVDPVRISYVLLHVIVTTQNPNNIMVARPSNPEDDFE